jgi:hypothetical protein
MAAEQTEIVGQDVAIELFAKLGAQGAAASATGQATEDGARHGSESDADRTGNGADARACRPPASAALTPRAAPPTVPMAALTFMA